MSKPASNVLLAEQTASNVLLAEQTASNVLLAEQTASNVVLAEQTFYIPQTRGTIDLKLHPVHFSLGPGPAFFTRSTFCVTVQNNEGRCIDLPGRQVHGLL